MSKKPAKKKQRAKQKKRSPPPPAGKRSQPRAPSSPPATGPLELGWPAAVVANLLILSTWIYAAILREVSRDFYTFSAQEDEYVEWGTFWGFMIAAAIFLLAAYRQHRSGDRLPWFSCGLSLFCAVVAMEEISWAQRVFGYRPPVYFLENNFQLELNVHNVMSTPLRKLALKIVILGYGVALPLLALEPKVKKLLARVGVAVPPLALAPAFFATYLFYEDYPWSLTGEWVELMLGLGFLFAALAALSRRTPEAGPQPWRLLARPLAAFVAAWVLVVGLGVANAVVSRTMRGAHPEIVAAARGELEALKRDFLSGRVKTKCNRHKRVYTFVEQYEQDYLEEGEYAALAAQGLPEERAEFFLDPWNSPYWFRDRCKSDDSRRVLFLYSFGPNRRRESSKYEILGDDVGVIIYDGKKVRDFVAAAR